jgi:hypothetical protein
MLTESSMMSSSERMLSVRRVRWRRRSSGWSGDVDGLAGTSDAGAGAGASMTVTRALPSAGSAGNASL